MSEGEDYNSMENKKNLSFPRQIIVSSKFNDLTSNKFNNNVISKRDSRPQPNNEGNKKTNAFRPMEKCIENKYKQVKGLTIDKKEEGKSKAKKQIFNEDQDKDVAGLDNNSKQYGDKHCDDFDNEKQLNSRKSGGSAQNLLKFYYSDSHRNPETQQRYNSNHGNYHYNGSKKSLNNKGRGYKGRAFFNKERFLQANCQFVVKSDEEYKIHAVDPDALADWSLIQQVRLTVHEAQYCPICLFAPKAAKITRCGHIYCWSCILHYLSLDDKSWRKCPICCDAVHPNDLKSVQASVVTKYVAGMQITMKLMKKSRGELTVVPRSQWTYNVGHLRSVRDVKQSSYAKLLTSDRDYVEEMMMQERVELMEMLMEEEENSLESSFIKLALDKLAKQITNWSNISSSSSSPSLPSSSLLTTPAINCIKDTHDKASSNYEEYGGSGKKEDKDGDEIIIDVGHTVKSIPEATNVKFYMSAFDDEEVEIEVVSKDGNGGGSDINDASGYKSNGSKALEEIGNSSDCNDDGDDNEDGVVVMVESEIGPKSCRESFGEVEVLREDEEEVANIGGRVGEDVSAIVISSSSNNNEHNKNNNSSNSCAAGQHFDGIHMCSSTTSMSHASSSMPNAERNILYFYQAADGQQVYMHPLNIRALKYEYNSLCQCPDEIVATILEVEERTMDESLRDRFRYLNHLPLSCEFKLVELDLRPPILSKETMEVFAEDRKSREVERKKKMKRDSKMAARIQREENRKMGIDPTVQIVRSDYNDKMVRSDVVTDDDDVGWLSAGFDHGVASTTTDANSSDFNSNNNTSSSSSVPWGNPVSFAQMIRKGKCKVQQPITANKQQQQQWPPSTSSTMVKMDGNKKLNVDEDEDGSEESMVPDFKMTWCEGLAERLKCMEMVPGAAAGGRSGGSGSCGGGGDGRKEGWQMSHDKLGEQQKITNIHSNGKDGKVEKSGKKKKVKQVLFSTTGVGPRC